MICRLHISNYALIDTLDIDFIEGLNIITGETGAGKSIMLGALGLLLGARADSRVIRSADRKSVVEAVFRVRDNHALAAWAAANNLDWDDEECIVRRELSPGGRTRAFVNDTPVTVAQLAEVGRRLIDIHSQNQNQLLASPDYQLQVIDSIAGNGDLLLRYKADYADFKQAEKKFSETKAEIERNRADEEFIRFRLAQLDEAQLVAGEQESLESERDLQVNMTQIKELLTNAMNRLSNSDESVMANMADAVDSVASLGEMLEGASALAERLESARVEIQDIVETLAEFDSNLGVDPDALGQIEERLGLLYSLQSRHHVESVQELIDIRNTLREQLEAIESGDMTLDDLRAEAVAAKKKAVASAKLLSASRKSAAGRFAAELFEVASPLGMANLRCDIAVESAGTLMPSGADHVEFRFAFNKNQTPTSVAGAASGGEVSRLMLAVKSIVSARLQLPTIVFDEVDTGVSGDIANRMGAMMRDMSGRLQVLTITHLPQVAAMGQSHYKVFKEDDADATHTRIRALSPDEREHELALMLSGSATDEAALANARALLSRK